MLVCFFIRYRKEVNLNGKGGEEEVGTEEAVIRIYYEKKIYFSIKQRNIKSSPIRAVQVLSMS